MKIKIEKPDSLLRKIKVVPLAAESFGVRSMCTFVETPDITVLLDAGISLCPYRFDLPPHPIEFQTIARLRKTIANCADKAEVVTVSHYHFDHHTPYFEDWLVNWTKDNETARQIYQDKIVLFKNSKEKIYPNQIKRARMFQKSSGKYAKVLETADGKTFTFGNTFLRFSEAVPHGSEDSILGWVIMAVVEYEDECFVFAPDVQGPISNRTLDLILNARPAVIMLGGPRLYLKGYAADTLKLEESLKNLLRIVEKTPVVILEHHTLRDESWQLKIKDIFDKASSIGHSVVTAAEFTGKKNRLFEYERKQLFLKNPPSDEFNLWMKTLNCREISKPPI